MLLLLQTVISFSSKSLFRLSQPRSQRVTITWPLASDVVDHPVKMISMVEVKKNQYVGYMVMPEILGSRSNTGLEPGISASVG
jgi:hypothetical protein